jgi:hypothetical protein
MNLLLGLFLGVMGVAAAVTIGAIRRAKEGFEDETGFHLSPPTPKDGGGSVVATGAPRDTTAGAEAPGAGLPPGLIGAG